jgi:hypothetical protein
MLRTPYERLRIPCFASQGRLQPANFADAGKKTEVIRPRLTQKGGLRPALPIHGESG